MWVEWNSGKCSNEHKDCRRNLSIKVGMDRRSMFESRDRRSLKRQPINTTFARIDCCCPLSSAKRNKRSSLALCASNSGVDDAPFTGGSGRLC